MRARSVNLLKDSLALRFQLWLTMPAARDARDRTKQRMGQRQKFEQSDPVMPPILKLRHIMPGLSGSG
jgi:hypothetical protein